MSGQLVCTEGKWSETRCFQALFLMNEKLAVMHATYIRVINEIYHVGKG